MAKGMQPGELLGLDEECLCDPEQPEDEIAEAKPPSRGEGASGRAASERAADARRRLRSVDQPDQQRKRGKQHRPQEQRRHGEHRQAAGDKGRRVAPPAGQRGYRLRECAQASGGPARVESKRGPGGAQDRHRRPHALSGSVDTAAAVALRGWWMRTFFRRRASASSTSSSSSARMAHELAADRHAPKQREHQAPERVDVLLLLGPQQLQPEVLLELA